MKSIAQWLPSRDGIALDRRRLPLTRATGWIHDRNAWRTYDEVRAELEDNDSITGYGFALTPSDPYFFIDIDDIVRDASEQWCAEALAFCGRFAGAHVEVSNGGNGLHIFGRSSIIPQHCNQNNGLSWCSKLELYTADRFAYVTDRDALGDSDQDCTDAFTTMCAEFFPPKTTRESVGWTDRPCDQWRGHEDDEDLIAAAIQAKSQRAELGGSAHFSDLWYGRADALATVYSAKTGNGEFDGSAADQALANHLAFWTGGNCDRMLSLMWRSQLVRDKWTERPGYLEDTIVKAVAMMTDVHQMRADITPTKPPVTPYEPPPAPVTIQGQAAPVSEAAPTTTAVATIEPHPTTDLTEKGAVIEPMIRTGPQIVGPDQIADYFAGCCYVISDSKVYCPGGRVMDKQRFDVWWGGYEFAMEHSGKSTTSAWEAFTQSRVMKGQQVDKLTFRPDLKPGAIYQDGGSMCINGFVPSVVYKKAGDVTPFLTHVRKLLPDPGDQELVLNYMAACVQMIGTKFQWWPVVQGTKGNGKTLLATCVEYAIGMDYTVRPRADTLAEKFNSYLHRTLFLQIEELRVPEDQATIFEVLKTMITNERQGIRRMQTDLTTEMVCCNGMANTNYRQAVPVDDDERRFAVLFTAQQERAHLERDGMTGDYFFELYEWLREEGFAIVAHYLSTRDIPEAFRRSLKGRAPRTSTTHEAISESLGTVEQYILERCAEGRPGFRGGWISSVALDKFLREDLRRGRTIAPMRRSDMLRKIGYVPHPALPDGRAPHVSMVDDGIVPVLYVRHDSQAAALAADAVMVAYVDAQR